MKTILIHLLRTLIAQVIVGKDDQAYSRMTVAHVGYKRWNLFNGKDYDYGIH